MKQWCIWCVCHLLASGDDDIVIFDGKSFDVEESFEIEGDTWADDNITAVGCCLVDDRLAVASKQAIKVFT